MCAYYAGAVYMLSRLDDQSTALLAFHEDEHREVIQRMSAMLEPHAAFKCAGMTQAGYVGLIGCGYYYLHKLDPGFFAGAKQQREPGVWLHYLIEFNGSEPIVKAFGGTYLTGEPWDAAVVGSGSALW